MYIADEEWEICEQCDSYVWNHMLIHMEAGAYIRMCPHCDYVHKSAAGPKYFTESDNAYRALWLLMREE